MRGRRRTERRGVVRNYQAALRVIGSRARMMLLCEECGRESDWEDVFTHVGDPRWKALLSIDNEAVIYCPECAERELGRDPSTPFNGSVEA